jgi:ubiquinone/menaquinone biosynthesis C-methylase UbiE
MREYLLTKQYKNAENLNARIELHRRFSTNTYGWSRFVFDQVLAGLPRDARVLEIGCGPATLWRASLDRMPDSWDVALSDFSAGMLDEARACLAGSGREFHFAEVNAQAIPYADASFDGIIANHMLYHVPVRDKALAEMRRVLAPGGSLFAATNGERHLIEFADLLRRAGMPEGWWRLPEATKLFTLENGREQLARHFAQVELRIYANALEVTEAEPLMAFLLSSSSRERMTEEHIARFRRAAEAEIASHGAVHISVEPGLFVARA